MTRVTELDRVADVSPPNAAQLVITPRTTLKRLPERGRYERAEIDAILDEALTCHLGFVHEGQPLVVPTIHARHGDEVLIHGSVASRMLRTLASGISVCLTVTIIDGLVVARSGFHSSMNYRSVMLMGVPRLLESDAERAAALDAIVEHVVPGRVAELRAPTRAELRQTNVFALPIHEGSAKVRTGGPQDDPEDIEGDAWAGVVPLRLVAGSPIDSDDLRCGIVVAPSAATYRRL